MKNPIKLKILYVFMLSLILFSCTENNNQPEEFLSDLTAEQQKERLDQEGLNFINHMEAMEEPDLMDPLVYFIEISQYLEADQFDLTSKVAQNIILSSNRLSTNSLKSLVVNDMTSFKKMMDDNQGTYTYNRSNETWRKTAATGKIEFIFPANKSTTTNNTTFIFNNLTTINVSNFDLYEDISDLPKTLDVNLKVASDLKYGYYITNEYNSDNIPTKETSKLVIAPYEFYEEYSLSNDKAVRFSSTMSIDNEVFLRVNANSDGYFTNDLLTSDETLEEDVVNNVNADIQIENVKLTGKLNFKNLAIKTKELETKYEDQYNYDNYEYPKAYYTDLVASMKTNGSLDMRFVDKNEIFATLEPYVSNEDDYYYEYFDTYPYYRYVEYTRYFVDFKIVFTDGSKVDDSYFDSGFSSVVDKLNSIIDKINYDYDEEIDPIEY